MELEQTYPDKPNFLKIVLISAVVILVLLVAALAAVHFDGKRLLHFGSSKTQASRLVLPGTAASRLV